MQGNSTFEGGSRWMSSWPSRALNRTWEPQIPRLLAIDPVALFQAATIAGGFDLASIQRLPRPPTKWM